MDGRMGSEFVVPGSNPNEDNIYLLRFGFLCIAKGFPFIFRNARLTQKLQNGNGQDCTNKGILQNWLKKNVRCVSELTSAYAASSEAFDVCMKFSQNLNCASGESKLPDLIVYKFGSKKRCNVSVSRSMANESIMNL
jgi:hypothetical protein